jgi:hemoglobin
MTKQTPTLYEWLGGMPALEKLTTRFYERVREDVVLSPIFEHMRGDHPRYVAQFLAEVFGGPADYSRERGGHPHMVAQHLAKHLSQEQRKQWVRLLLDTADEIGLPDDPEFRSAFVAYIEWGSRLAVINSQPGGAVDPAAPMPRWGWGEVGGPYSG